MTIAQELTPRQAQLQELRKLVALRNQELDAAEAILKPFHQSLMIANGHRRTAASVCSTITSIASELAVGVRLELQGELKSLRTQRKGSALERLDFYSPQLHIWAGPDGLPIEWLLLVEKPGQAPFGHWYGPLNADLQYYLHQCRYGVLKTQSTELIPNEELKPSVIGQVKLGRISIANLYIRAGGTVWTHFPLSYLMQIRAFNVEDITPQLSIQEINEINQLLSDATDGRSTAPIL